MARTIGAICGNLLQSHDSIETHSQEKCLKDVQEAMPGADSWGLLKDPHGGNEGKKDMKTGSTSEKKNSLASERGHIKQTE